MMALSSTPADPPSSNNNANTAASAVITTTPRLFTTAPSPSRSPRPQTSLFPHPPSHYHHSHLRLPSQQPHQQPLYASQPFANLSPRVGVSTASAAENRGVLYPVASSGRGFLPKAIRSQSADQMVTNANQVGFLPRPVIRGVPYSHTFRAFGFPHSDRRSHHLIRPPHVHHTFLGSTGGSVMSGAAKGVPVSGQLKVAPSQPSVSECNGYRDQRDRSREDTFASVKDRKVRIYKGSSLYALCRSWLRNGFPEESQAQHVDGVKLLPRPMPVTDAAVKKEGGEEEEERSVENLSPKDLLQRHVKRGKRVRARLREERLQRIERYKTRLSLLLPPLAEQQQFRNDTTASNCLNT